MGSAMCKGYGYIETKRSIEQMCSKYTFLSKSIIGRSCLGRDITAVKLGNADNYALITAALRGCDYITASVLLYFIDELCSAVAANGSIAGFNARKAMYNRGVIFVPAVNPDGCEIAVHGRTAFGNAVPASSGKEAQDYEHWSGNARGVEINKNFSAGWDNITAAKSGNQANDISRTGFKGCRPESEPETIALTDLCNNIRIRHVTAILFGGESISWKYGSTVPAKSERMAEILATSGGYTLLNQDTGTGGELKDWFISNFSRPGFTMRIGKKDTAANDEEVYSIYNRIREMLMLLTIM